MADTVIISALCADKICSPFFSPVNQPQHPEKRKKKQNKKNYPLHNYTSPEASGAIKAAGKGMIRHSETLSSSNLTLMPKQRQESQYP
ncbi:hypothetical protein FIM25_04065 [Desulfobotulus mexicanus]|uniref:Uncharacterized protein n=1 Tax=Desulfobotulus mexicanus TaxID=2586642 RepID=A0A5Q4VI04_9BACT|nr:hypothetical protein FIM25_04065 [Desulfobotulus mexicanus]